MIVPADASSIPDSCLPFAGMRCQQYSCSNGAAAEHGHYGESPPKVAMSFASSAPSILQHMPLLAVWSVVMTHASLQHADTGNSTVASWNENELLLP